MTCHICGRDTEHEPGTGYDPICECAGELKCYREALEKIASGDPEGKWSFKAIYDIARAALKP